MMIRPGLAEAQSATCAVGRSTVAIGCAVLCLLAISCGDEPPPETLGAIHRFVESAPQEIFEPRDIAVESAILDLSPDPGDETGGWKLGGIAKAVGWKDGRLHLRLRGEGDAVLTRAIDRPAAGIDVIELEMGGLRPWNSVRVMWADEDRGFGNRRSLRLGARLGEETDDAVVFRFEVGRESSWSDAVTRIRIVVTGERQSLFLGRVVGIDRTLDTDRLAAALDGGWLFELDGHHRGVRFGAPGEAIEATVGIPAGAELDFAVGVPSSQPSPVRFLVSATPVDGDESSSVVFDETVGGDRTDEWIDRTADLSHVAGRSVRLVLAVETPEDFDPLLGLPAWADPVVRAPSTDPRPPNIVLISLDTVRADRMSLYGYHRPTTPRIREWARDRGIVFESVVAPSPWTLPSHVSILTGIDALGHGVNHPAPAPTTLVTLAEMLRSKGYTTAAVTGGSYLHPRFGLAQGFDDYRSYKGDLADELETSIGEALSWLDANASRAPFFLFFHTYEAHDPYDPREPYFSRFAGAPFDPAYRDAVTRNDDEIRPDRLRGTNRFVLRGNGDREEELVSWDDVAVVSDLYDSGIAYTDELVGALLERLSRSDLEATTLVILTSDHGEAMGEHRLAGHTSLYDHDLLVPLVVALPGAKGHGARVPTQVRSVDIVATALEIVGLAAPPGIDGRSLVPLMAGDERDWVPAESYTALSNHGLSIREHDRAKYIYRNLPWEVPTGWEEYYDLDADPDELHDLAGEAPGVDALRSLARDTLVARESGVRVTLTNRGGDPCRIELSGTGISIGASTVKSIDQGGGCAIVDRGRIACDLAPDSVKTLVCERVLSPMIVIDGTIAVDAAAPPVDFTLSFEVGADVGSRGVVFDPAAGTLSDGPAGDETVSVGIDWTGNPGILGLDPASIDMELRRQLEALGYIEQHQDTDPE